MRRASHRIASNRIQRISEIRMNNIIVQFNKTVSICVFIHTFNTNKFSVDAIICESSEARNVIFLIKVCACLMDMKRTQAKDERGSESSRVACRLSIDCVYCHRMNSARKFFDNCFVQVHHRAVRLQGMVSLVRSLQYCTVSASNMSLIFI